MMRVRLRVAGIGFRFDLGFTSDNVNFVMIRVIPQMFLLVIVVHEHNTTYYVR